MLQEQGRLSEDFRPKVGAFCSIFVKSKGRLQVGEAWSPLFFTTPPISKAQEISEIISQQIQQRSLFSLFSCSNSSGNLLFYVCPLFLYKDGNLWSNLWRAWSLKVRRYMRKHQQNIEPSKSDKVVWLTNKIFTAFPQEVTGLKFCILDCGCIYPIVA